MAGNDQAWQYDYQSSPSRRRFAREHRPLAIQSAQAITHTEAQGELTPSSGQSPRSTSTEGTSRSCTERPSGAVRTEPVNLAFDGGWMGLVSKQARFPFPAVMRCSGRQLRCDFSFRLDHRPRRAAPATPHRQSQTRNNANESMRLTGDAQFRYERARSNCSLGKRKWFSASSPNEKTGTVSLEYAPPRRVSARSAVMQ